MASFLLFTALLGLSGEALAQAQKQVTWSAFTFTYHGEKIPDMIGGTHEITPFGAQQVLEAGEILRNRYILPPQNGSELTTWQPITGLSQYGIDNSQLTILSTDDEFVSASAMAFMQGLYPPRSGVTIDEESMLGNGTLEQYPLSGYQYPNINAMSALDFNYVWLAGNIGCNNYAINQAESLITIPYSQEIANTEAFYLSLNQTLFWGFNPTLLNYGNAWDLYEYALYQYNHNTTIYNQTGMSDTIKQLYNLASAQVWDFNSGSASNITTIAGRTLGSIILSQFSRNIDSFGLSDKISLLFGSYEPFVSFFSLSGLSTGPSASRFTSLPLHGSMMTFELFSYTNISATTTPVFPMDTSDLWVRFLFRNGTGELDPLLNYPLFGRGNSEVDMSWQDFVEGMGLFSLEELWDWCSECGSTDTTLFCEALVASNLSDSGSGSGGSSLSVSPVVGGVIGAAVTIAVFILLGGLLAILGFRVDRHGRGRQKGTVGVAGVLSRKGSGAGGFKGREKLESDLDLTIPKGAGDGVGASVVKHERVGSWELKDSPTGTRRLSKDFEADLGSERVVSNVDYGRNSEDGIGNANPFGDPIRPVDHV